MQLVTVKSVSAMLNVSESTVRRLIESGSLRSIKIGRSVRVDVNDIDHMIENARRNKPVRIDHFHCLRVHR
jgi:excisionase family DNA binding protein